MPAISPRRVARPATDAPRRSPVLARTVLLGAVAAGLTGLAALPGASDQVTLTASSTSASEVVSLGAAEPAALHGLTTRPAPRAQRTRALPAKPTATAPAPAKTTAKTSRTTARKRAVRTNRWYRPSSAGVISGYGMRHGRMHEGVDFGDSYGAPIRAIGDGVVVGVGYQSGESGYGKITIIRHSNGYYSAYAHQSSYSVSVGERVSAGEVIGRVGSTGHSSGPHLHFEVRTSMHEGQVNPRTFLAERGVYL